MQLRTIAVFHTISGIDSPWSCTEGIVTNLATLGYHALDCGRPGRINMPIEILQQADLIILSGIEHYAHQLIERYGQAWQLDLPAPKVAWYQESAHRDDRSFPFGSYRDVADLHYFPAAQDADEFKGEWLPFGVDSDVFNPRPVDRHYNAAFLGQMYPKRKEYVKNIEYPLTYLAPVSHSDQLRHAQLLAEAYSSIRIFVNLPSYSRLLVTKVAEAMACRAMVITPEVDHPSGTWNMTQFENGKHLVYYDSTRPHDIGNLVKHYLDRPDELNAIATSGWQEVMRAHTLRHRLLKIIGDVQGRGSRNVMPQGIYRLISHHDTLLFLDTKQRRLRHGLPSKVPQNLVLDVIGDRARLLSFDIDTKRRSQLRLDTYQGYVAVCNEHLGYDLELRTLPDAVFGISFRKNFLAADLDGVVRNDRRWCREHEHYRLHKIENLTSCSGGRFPPDVSVSQSFGAGPKANMFEDFLRDLECYGAKHDVALTLPDDQKFLVFSTEFYQDGSKRSVGGFADRLKGMLSTALLAVLTDRVFLVDWRSPMPIADHFDRPHLNWNRADIIGDATASYIVDAIDPEGYSKYRQYLRENQDAKRLFGGQRIARVHSNMLAINDFLDMNDLLVQTPIGRTLIRILNGRPTDLVVGESFSTMFNYLLSYRPKRRAVEMWQDFQRRRTSGPMIGVQFRSGGHDAWPGDGDMDDVGNAEAVRDGVVKIAESLFSGNAQIFIASDSAEFRTRLTELMTGIYPVCTYKGDIYHYERSSRDPVAGVDFAIFEFMCLSRCDYVIHGVGEFGLTAARVGLKAHSDYRNIVLNSRFTKQPAVPAIPAVSPGTLVMSDLRELLNTDTPIILDIGANDGETTAELLKVFPHATIFAFEPDARAIEKFKKRFNNDPRVRLFEIAIGSHDHDAEFYISSGLPPWPERFPGEYASGWDQSGSLRAPKTHCDTWPWVKFEKTTTVHVRQLDTWAKEHGVGRFDFIWADVQGAEGDLVRGGASSLANTRYFYTEYSNIEWYEGQCTLPQLVEMLNNFIIVRLFEVDVLFQNTGLAALRAG